MLKNQCVSVLVSIFSRSLCLSCGLSKLVLPHTYTRLSSSNHRSRIKLVSADVVCSKSTQKSHFFFRSPMPCCESHSSTKLMARLVGVCSKDQVRSFHTRQIPISIEENLLVIIFSSPYRRSNLSSLRR